MNKGNHGLFNESSTEKKQENETEKEQTPF
jgi:hypothetical protein